MTRDRPFLLVGLTGGIATGKSTVSNLFRDLGCVVIDADLLAREVVEPDEPAYRAIVAEFGPGVLHADGTLDRKKLGAIVFAEPARRARLEAMTHPEIRARLARRLAELTERQFHGIVIFDAPVIVESGNHRTVDRLIVVTTDEATQSARLRARDGMSGDEATRRIESQIPLEKKAKLADFVIDNSGPPAATAAQVRRVYAALLEELSASTAGCGP
jgi:dephospho-CoA kinase